MRKDLNWAEPNSYLRPEGRKYNHYGLTIKNYFCSIFYRHIFIILGVSAGLSLLPVLLNAQNTPPAAYTGSWLNYTRTWDATAPEQSPTNLVTRPLTDVKQTTKFYDGFGKLLQIVNKQASPQGSDMVAPYLYDGAGREIFKYLPFTSNVATSGDVINSGNFKKDVFQQQVSFYNTQLSGQPGETNVGSNSANWAYSQTTYEASPLNRPLNTYGPGANWVGNSAGGHNKQVQHCLNTDVDAVIYWAIGAQGTLPVHHSPYIAGYLFKTINTDEAGHQTIEFKDQYGQVVLRKVQNTATADNGTGSAYTGWLCTYYVYDDYGHLRFVITPDVVAQISGTWVLTQAMADELCYRFEYDAQNRIIIKKAPGTPTGSQGEVWMVYDARNRLVMSQDGNLRTTNQWLCYLYDGADRQVMTGLISYGGGLSTLQSAVTQQTTPPPVPSGTLQSDITLSSTTSGDYQALNSITLNPGFTTVTGGEFSATVVPGYGSSAGQGSVVSGRTINLNPIPSGVTFTPLTATYYDNYAWLSTVSTPFSATRSTSGDGQLLTPSNTTAPYPQALTQSTMTMGMVTGTMSTVPGTSKTLYSINYYDEMGRVIQQQTTNYTGGTDIVTTQYAWNGKTLATYIQHQKAGTNSQTHNVLTKMTYDAMDRLQSLSKYVSSVIGGTAYTTPVQTIETNTYNELGQLKQKTLGNSMETMQYDYNVRGWLLGVNRAFAKTAGSTANHFGYDVGYDNTAIAASGGGSIGGYAAASYNGNIAGTVWKSVGDNQIRKYDYAYDPTGRLTGADFNQQTSGFNKTAGLDFSVTIPQYDANGNIGQMTQNGWLLGGSQQIDNLVYTYQTANASNRLLNVVDNSPYNSAHPASTLGDLHYAGSKSSSSQDYGYDANGNITSDFNRSVSAITYSYLNKAQQITITGKGSIQYIYDAQGNKLQKITTDNSVAGKTVTTTTTYVGCFMYQSRTTVPADPNNPDYTDVLQFIGTEDGRVRFKAPVGGVAGSYVFDYFIRDNTNNVRMVLTDEQQQDIYPAATLESNTVATESNYYSIVNDASHVVQTGNLTWWPSSSNGGVYADNNGIANPGDPTPTATSAQVYKLNGQTGDKFGLGITLKVMAGDQISIFGKSVWHNTGASAGSFPITSILSTFINSFAGSSAVAASTHGAVTGATLNGASATTSGLTTYLNNAPNQTNPSTTPKAGINWILFNDQFVPVAMGTNLVSATADAVFTHNFPLNIPMAANGYLYVYCSNESDIDVYFDNLQVVNTRGPILEEAHYYPDGLLMAGISDRAWNKLPNYYHYQSNELQDGEFADGTGLAEYDFGARQYDQQLGVWHSQDPASQYASPYVAMGNSWPNGVDRDGKSFWSFLEDVGAFFALGGIGYIGASLESNGHVFTDVSNWNSGWWKGALVGDIVAAAALITLNPDVAAVALGSSSAATAGTFSTYGLVSSAIDGAATGIGMSVLDDIKNHKPLNFDDLLQSAAIGAVMGDFKSTGGFGLLQAGGSFNDIAYNVLKVEGGTALSNVENGRPAFSSFGIPLGPVEIMLGKGQTLLQFNSYNIASGLNLLNGITGNELYLDDAYRVNGFGGWVSAIDNWVGSWKSILGIHIAGLARFAAKEGYNFYTPTPTLPPLNDDDNQ